AAYHGRIVHVWGTRSRAHGDQLHPPSTYLKRVWVGTIVFTSHQFEARVSVFGVDKVMMGTIIHSIWASKIRSVMWSRRSWIRSFPKQSSV
ncbi:MAG: hypothetical protein OSB69_06590, partial [Alphaproteobacteria bacterium]|nr:hypothetical protein [Alphaproteobacteria bacterium]